MTAVPIPLYHEAHPCLGPDRPQPYKARALEHPVMRCQFRDADGHIQQTSMSCTMPLRPEFLTREQLRVVVDNRAEFFRLFGCELLMVEFLTHQPWEL